MLEQIFASDNVSRALRRVKSNKGASGVDGMTVDELQPFIDTHWIQLEASIFDGSYKPSLVRQVEIPKPNGGKRQLGIPTVIDRLIQQCISQYLQSIYEPEFSEQSYGFRPCRSAQHAVKQAEKYLNQGYTKVIETDLEKFFDVVCHDRLMSRLSLKIKDKRVLDLIRKFLRTGILSHGRIEQRSQGTPQGSPLSPLLSNIILDELDKELEKRGHKFVRYADDLSIYMRSRKAAKRVEASIYRFIEEKLKLKINREKSKISVASKSELLGFSFYHNRRCWRIRISDKSYQRFKTKIRELTSRRRSISIDYRLNLIKVMTRGWINYFKIADGKKNLMVLDSWIRFRLRMCIWKTWKRVKTRIANLAKLGMTQFNAIRNGNTRKGYCRVAHSGILHTTLTNNYLANLGYTSLEGMYLKCRV